MNNKQRRVLMVIRWPIGGIRTFIRYVYRNFDPDLWQFSVLAPDVDEFSEMRDDLAGMGVCFIPVVERPAAAEFSLGIARELSRNRYDLVHSHGFTSGLCSILPASIRRIPHLMTSHDVINPEQFKGRGGWWKQQVMGFLLQRLDCIHSVSHDAQENLLNFFPRLIQGKGSCKVIPNGIEVERFLLAEHRDLRGELGLSEECFLIGFFGRFMSQKGFRYLVEAIELVRERNLPLKPLVLAFGWGGFIREEQQSVREKGLDDYFRFMPFVSNVAGAIKGLDVVVMPSLWEACPLLAMETLVSGVPLIGTDCIGLREVTFGTPTIQVPIRNSLAISEALIALMQDSQTEKFAAFTSEAIRRFDVKVQASALESLYCSLSK